jgi:catechol 2,3-dioxygenase-like lactoylglutathione lyase family enzyme
MTDTGAPIRLRTIVLDAPDIEALAAFYSELTGWEVVHRDDDWITMHTDAGRRVAFQLAPDHIAPEWPGQDKPQQFHLDLQIDDTEKAALRAAELGATRLADGPTWITMADPAGHPFDLCQKDGVGPTMGLFAPTIDAPDASGLGRFYADMLGMEVAYDGPEGALLTGDGASLMFQQISDYTAPAWPDPSRPQQAHLDLTVDDLDAGEARVLALGATKLDGGEESFRVYADPAGHPFCLCID